MKYKIIIDKEKDEEITITVHSPSVLTKEIENLVLNYNGRDSILGYNDDETVKLNFSDIECITVIERKVVAIDKSGKTYRLQERLKELEEILPSYFIRINKSSLANEHSILKFKASFSGGVDAIFKCGYKDYVSRRCFPEIKRRYEGL